MKHDFESVTENVRGRMAVRNVTVTRLAEAMEARGFPISREWLSRKLADPQRFSLGELTTICDILGLKLADLIAAA